MINEFSKSIELLDFNEVNSFGKRFLMLIILMIMRKKQLL